MKKGYSYTTLVVTVAFVIMLIVALFFLTFGKEIAGKIIDQIFEIFFPRPPS